MSGAARNRGDDPSKSGPPKRPNFDGPGSGTAASASGAGSGGRAPSNAPSVVSQRSAMSPITSPRLPQAGPSTIASASGSYGNPPPTTMTDPALERPQRATDALRLMDIAASCFNYDNIYGVPVQYAKRPGFNTTGREVNLSVNSYGVLDYPTKAVFQYDVLIGNGAEKRAVIEKVWATTARKNNIPEPVIFDGNKLAWSLQDNNRDVSFIVDLDAEQNRRPGNKPNTFRVVYRKTKKLNPATLEAFLNGRTSFSNDVLESLNFLQHLLRTGPTKDPRFIILKNKFFTRDGERMDLGGGIEVFRGIFQSLRQAHQGRLVVNLDVANTCFWRPMLFTNMVVNKFRKNSIQEIANGLFENKKPTSLFNMLGKHFKRLRVTPKYRGNPQDGREFVIKGFITDNAKEYQIDYKNPRTGVEKTLTVQDYFREKYGLNLSYPNLPLVEMTKRGVMYPMELLHLIPNQKYNFKLDEQQTQSMIKFAVSRPDVRMKSINEGKSWLNWSDDRYLKAFGLKISQEMISTKARLLPNPKVLFGGTGTNASADPRTSGRWDLRGRKFIKSNTQDLHSWGVGVFPRTNGSYENMATLEKYWQDVVTTYRGHGGKIANPPRIVHVNSDAAKAVEQLWLATGNNFQKRPQLLVFMVTNRESFHYLRVKKSCDCRYGVVSQVMQLQQMTKGGPSYISNVLMKVNAKLGGCTANAQSLGNSGFKALKPRTLILGADVSHPSPGSMSPSTAALTVSLDTKAVRYAAVVQTNGHRVEMISENNFKNMFFPMLNHWATAVGGGMCPEHVYYFRDGVSEGQYQHVLHQEVPRIKKCLDQLGKRDWKGKITVVIASKRHNVRAFPKKGESGGDKNGNPQPGTVIERDCTTAFEWDFYLYSHFALQGTARPVHYTVIRDDGDHNPNFLMNMIYEHCYQYVRSTTSVSLHPAVYYAHLASNRAKSHENIPSSEGPQGGPGYKMTNKQSDTTPPPTEVKPLIPLFHDGGITHQMWFI